MEARIRTGYMQLIFYSAFSLSRFQQVARLDAGQIRHTSRIGTTFSVCASCKRRLCLDLRKNRLKSRAKTSPKHGAVEMAQTHVSCSLAMRAAERKKRFSFFARHTPASTQNDGRGT